VLVSPADTGAALTGTKMMRRLQIHLDNDGFTKLVLRGTSLKALKQPIRGLACRLFKSF
jgi:hypothetical protein